MQSVEDAIRDLMRRTNGNVAEAAGVRSKKRTVTPSPVGEVEVKISEMMRTRRDR